MIFSVRVKGSGSFFLTTLYSPYNVDKARTIATHQPAILNKYFGTLGKENSQKTRKRANFQSVITIRWFTFKQKIKSFWRRAFFH